jgi:hypothetical protein
MSAATKLLQCFIARTGMDTQIATMIDPMLVGFVLYKTPPDSSIRDPWSGLVPGRAAHSKNIVLGTKPCASKINQKVTKEVRLLTEDKGICARWSMGWQTMEPCGPG